MPLRSSGDSGVLCRPEGRREHVQKHFLPLAVSLPPAGGAPVLGGVYAERGRSRVPVARPGYP